MAGSVVVDRVGFFPYCRCSMMNEMGLPVGGEGGWEGRGTGSSESELEASASKGKEAGGRDEVLIDWRRRWKKVPNR